MYPRNFQKSHLGFLHRCGKVQAAAMMSWNLPFTTLLGKVHELKAGLGVEEKNAWISAWWFQNNEDWPITGWWQLKKKLFSSQYIWGRWTQFDSYFSEGLKPPTRWGSSNWLIPFEFLTNCCRWFLSLFNSQLAWFFVTSTSCYLPFARNHVVSCLPFPWKKNTLQALAKGKKKKNRKSRHPRHWLVAEDLSLTNEGHSCSPAQVDILAPYLVDFINKEWKLVMLYNCDAFRSPC